MDTVPQSQAGKSMGYINLSTSLAMILSPILGGLVYDRNGYTAVFAMAFGVIGLDLALRITMIERYVAQSWMSEERQTNSDTSTEIELRDAVSGRTSSAISHSRDVDSPTGIAHHRGEQHNPMTPGDGVTSAVADSHGQRLRQYISLLKAPNFLAALWGCFVQATILTAFDSVCAPLD